jgi:pyrimidine-nucleoside phosphorylase/thymidine phosphorylase
MVDIGNSLGRQTVAVITDMNQPLGHEVGNANEIREAIEVLQGKGAEDETTVALTIASHMTVLAGAFADFETAYAKLTEIIKSGVAIEKLKELVRIQGGKEEVVDNIDLLPQAKNHFQVKAAKDGFVEAMEAESIGVAAMLLGAGRKTKEDVIDPAAGITLVKKVGEKVSAGDTLCILHTNLENAFDAEAMIQEAYSISETKPKEIKYIHAVIR